MIACLNPCGRVLGVSIAAMMLSGVVLAESTRPTTVDMTSHQIVVKDAATGELRAATPSEANALNAFRASASVLGPLNTVARSHASGARGVRLNNEFLHHTVMVKLPDGSLVERCVHTAEELEMAQKKLAGMQSSSPLPTE